MIVGLLAGPRTLSSCLPLQSDQCYSDICLITRNVSSLRSSHSFYFDVSVCLGGPQASAADEQLRLGATSVPAGARLPYSLTNAGTGCLLTGVSYGLERQEADGSYTRVNAHQLFIAIGLMLAPGKTYDGIADIPAEATAGTYRLSHSWSSATFEVTLP